MATITTSTSTTAPKTTTATTPPPQRRAVLKKGALASVEVPPGQENNPYYQGDPSPAAIDKAVADWTAESPDNAILARFFRETFGVQSPELMLIFQKNVIVENVPPPEPPATQAAA